jgi:hypothetical protein
MTTPMAIPVASVFTRTFQTEAKPSGDVSDCSHEPAPAVNPSRDWQPGQVRGKP